MEDFSNLPIEELLRPEGFACECGKHHRVPLRHLALGAGALGRLPDVLRACGSKNPFVVMDGNTRQAAGDDVCKRLSAAGFPIRCYCFPQQRVIPDEFAVGQVAMELDPACDLILAVGSGTINDVCKIVARASGRPLAVVATAPSMDGYASNSSSMISAGVKITSYSVCPVAIVADTDILRRAPARMMQAGLGDMLAKYVSICEWRITALVNGEYYCESVAQMMRNALRKCASQPEAYARREPGAVQAVAEGLILSGIAMSFAEVSRPASGLEHYFSHIWEMWALVEHRLPELHGIEVGIGTLLTRRLYTWLQDMKPSREKAQEAFDRFDEEAWVSEIRRVFGRVADEVLKIEKQAGNHTAAKHNARLERILSGWPEILRIVGEELPPYEELERVLRAAGGPALPGEIGLSPAKVRDALLASMEIRDKYIGSRLLWDLGLLGEMADRLAGPDTI